MIKLNSCTITKTKTKPSEHIFRCGNSHTFENLELLQYCNWFESALIAKQYDEMLTAAKQQDENNSCFVSNVTDKADTKFKYLWPSLTNPDALTIGLRLSTCLQIGDEGEAKLRNIFVKGSPFHKLLLIQNSLSNPTIYGRPSYSTKDKGIIVSTIQSLFSQPPQEAWSAVKRALFDQMKANNAKGENPIERINLTEYIKSNIASEVRKECQNAKKIKAKAFGVNQDGRESIADASNQWVLYSPEFTELYKEYERC